MGSPKALLPWRDSTLLDCAIDAARSASVDHIVVVLGPATRELNLSVQTAFNPSPESGRSTSIRLGAATLPDALDAVLIQSVDQPTTPDILNALFTTIGDTAEVAVPTYKGKRGHPVCFAGHLLGELLTITEADQGLRAVVRRHAVTEVPVEDESVIWNLNDPAAYAEARARA
jgi:CTP:molybdopterin cytidylyltransferase MocA